MRVECHRGLSVKTLYVYYNSLSIDILITDIIFVMRVECHCGLSVKTLYVY